MQITIHSKGAQQGPFPEEQVKQLLQSGEVSYSDLGWSPGMPEWKPLAAFPELQDASSPPPLPRMAMSPEVPAQAATEPLAIWSLVLGIFSIVGCSVGGFLAGIPAVICGHLGRSKIRKNPTLRGAGMALAGLIAGYIGLAVVPVAIVAAIAIPNIASITQSADAATARRNAQHLASVASAARAAGYTRSWASKEDAIRDLTAGIKVNGATFKVEGMTPKNTIPASKHLRLDGNNLTYTPSP